MKTLRDASFALRRRSSSSSAASGHKAAQMITTLESLNPPRLNINSHGRIGSIRSWMKR
jgi:hypothetical protein